MISQFTLQERQVYEDYVMLNKFGKGPWDTNGGHYFEEDINAMLALQFFYDDRDRMDNELQKNQRKNKLKDWNEGK